LNASEFGGGKRMVKMVMLGRVTDGLILSALTEDEQAEVELVNYRQMAKDLLKRMSAQSEARCSVEAGEYVFHYLIEFNVCYLCLCNKVYPKRLAFAFLEELQHEFHTNYGTEVDTAARPYAFLKFDPFVQKTKKAYQDTRTKKNLATLNDELQDVTRIMTLNIKDVLGRGEKLDKMTELSNQLSMESKKYVRDAKKLNLQLLYRKYGAPLAVVVIVLLVIYIRFSWF